MQPLRVRADLVNGYAAKDPWSPSLDGILAAVMMRERLGDELMASPQPSALEAVEGLPLDVIRSGDLWWYAASSPIIVGLAARERRHFHRRFDDHMERHMVGGVKRVMTAAGPYKATRLHDTRVICRALEWHVIGDRPQIEALIARIDQIGGRRGVGYGRVARWTVHNDGDREIARMHRPIPASGSASGQTMPWGLVPPVRWRPVECLMPEARYADA